MRKKVEIRCFHAYIQLTSFPGQTPTMQIQKESIRGPGTRKLGIRYHHRERGERRRDVFHRGRISIILVTHSGDEPLEHTLITEHELAQVLNHAGPLSSEVFHGLDDQVQTRVLKSFHVRVCAVHALSL